MRPPPSILRFSVRYALAGLLLAGCDNTGKISLDDSHVVATDDSQTQLDDTGITTDDCDDPQTWYPDRDGDEFGANGGEVEDCEQPDGFVLSTGDCNDNDATLNPYATELCNDIDDNCDGVTDEGFDLDEDGHSNDGCEGGDDCDDGDATAYPGADDPCSDGVDQDCDGEDLRCSGDVDLADADAKFWATGRGDDAGEHMDSGDINGDGFKDVVVGEMWADGYQGGAFILYGPLSGKDTLDNEGVEISGGTGAYEAGRTVGVGDLNSDGYDDIFVGSPDATTYDAVMFFGPVTSDVKFADADVLTYCGPPIECGHGGDVADITGDGVADTIIAAGEEDSGGYYAGSVYVVYGPLSEDTFDLQLGSDAKLVGETAGSETGRILTAGGDVDGDGVGDALITASYDSTGGPYAGAVHVVYGPLASMDLGDSDGKLIGAAAYDYAGESLAMGDLDGDGLSDAIVGAYAAMRGNGSVYMVPGPAAGTTSLSTASAIIRGGTTSGMGTSLASRDVDNDGPYDLLAGAGDDAGGGVGAGAAYLYFGPLAGTYATSGATAKYIGEAAQDGAGNGVGLGDVSGDGSPDILIGATTESTGAMSAGALYVVNSIW